MLSRKMGGKGASLGYWLGGGFSLFVILGCCLVVGIWALFYRDSAVLFAGSGRFPQDQVKILDETRQSIDANGEDISFGGITVEVPAGAVADEATLIVAEVRPGSLPVAPPDDVVGEVYALEWETGSASTGEERITVTLSYDPENLPKDASEHEMVIATFDGEEWLQLPTQVDTRNQELTAEVRHFSYFGALWNAAGLGYETERDVQFRGAVQYTDGRYPDDPNTRLIPAAYLGYAVVDADGVILHEGFLDANGAFEFTLAEGTAVGFGLDPLVRVYAESPLAGKVKRTTELGAGVHTYNSDVLHFSDASTPSDIRLNIEIPIEESGPFKILNTIYWGQYTALWLENHIPLPNPTVIWGGPDHNRYQYTDTGFTTSGDNQNTYIYIGNDPQAAWDEDVILSIYGQYWLYWLYGEARLDCTGRMGEMNRQVSACNAWVEGFGLYFSALARDASVYEAYEFENINPITYDLAYDQFSADQRSPGAVAQILWQLSDGTTNRVNRENIIQIMMEHDTSIESLEDLYYFWEVEFGMTRDECLLFAQREVIDAQDCDDDFSSDQADESPIARHTIEYGTQASSTLSWGARDIWGFDGLADDAISILVLKIDDDLDFDMNLIQAWDNRVVETVRFDETNEYVEWQARLENNGEYLILVDALESEGQYTVFLELMERWVNDDEAAPAPEEDSSPAMPDPDAEIKYGQTITDEYLSDGSIDWWEFAGQADDVISILFWSEDENFDPYLYFGEDASGDILVETGPTGSDPYQISVDQYTLPNDGLYFIGVGSAHGDGYYGVSLYLEDAAEPVEESGSASDSFYDEIDLGGVHYSDGATSFDFDVPSGFTRVEIGCYDVTKEERNYHQYCGWRGELQLNGEYVYDWVDWNSTEGGIYHNYILGEDVKTAIIDASGFLDITPMIQSGWNTVTLDHNTDGAGIGMVVRIYTE